jgi:phosphoribosylanthranilate isomerase
VAETIATKVPPFVTTVGVFVEQGPEEIVKIVRRVGLRGVQLHGDHTPEDARAVAEQAELTLIRAVRVAEKQDLEATAAFRGIVSHVLLDTKVEGLTGGTGTAFPWELATQAKAFGVPLFLAGGSPPRTSVRRRVRCSRSPWTWPRAWSKPSGARTSLR